MPKTMLRALPLAAAALLATAPLAAAGAPGTWTQLTQPLNASSTDTAALARTADGVLHVAFEQRTPANVSRDDVVHAAIRPDGSLALTNRIADSWTSVSALALVADASGLRAVFAGTPDLPRSPALRTSTAAADGAAWTLQDADVASGTDAHIGPHDAAYGPDGQLVSIWGETPIKASHGLTALADANAYPILESGCCQYVGALATSAAGGTLWAAWYSNANRPDNPNLRDEGYFYSGLDPATGAAIARTKAPQSSVASGQNEQALSPDTPQETALAALGGGRTGVLLAYPQGYPTGQRVRVLDVTTGALRTIGGTPRVGNVALAADADGRAWLAYTVGDERIVVRRSNRGATVWGAAVRVAPQKGTDSVWSLQGDAQAGLLDLVATLKTPGGQGAWHTQVRPRLSLTIKPGSVSATAGGTFAFTVTDAGDPVAGATVKVGQKTLTTNGKGVANLTVAKGAKRGTRAVTASRAGYVPATGAVRVRR